MLTRWEPFRDVVTLRDAMDRLLERSFLRPFDGEWYGGQSLALDMSETTDEMVVKASVPGVKPEDLKITLSGDVLTISAETKAETEKKDATYHLKERRYGKFSRSLTLPTAVKADQVKAEFETGVVTLTLPKEEEVRPKTIQVKVK